MMDKNKLLILIILSIFIVGMVLAPASASHKVKVGKYKGKLTNKQYKKLKSGYKKNKKVHVTIKSSNYKHHKIYIRYLNGYEPQSGKYFKKGFYADVWDTRYGIDGTKCSFKKIHV